MKKTVDIILIVLIFLIIFFLQTNLFTWFNIGGIMPNLFVVFIMMIGLFLKKDCGFFFGALFGLLLDFFVGTKIGTNAIALAIIGLASGILEKNFSKDNRMTVMIMTSILTAIFELIIILQKIIFGELTSTYFLEFIKILLIEVLYNDILIIILYPIFSKIGNKLENDFTNKSFLKIL